MKKKLNVSHLLWHTVFLRVAYTYSDCSREAYVSTREELHFQQGVLFLIKILDFYYMLCPRRTGDSLEEE